MRNRDTLLAAVQQHIRQAVDNERPEVLLEEHAAGLARELAAAADPSQDLEAAYWLGTFHWLRYLALPEGDDEPELVRAWHFFTPVHHAEPDAVPEQLQAQFARGDDPEILIPFGNSLMIEYEKSGELPLFRQAIAHYRQSLARTAPRDPQHLMCLNNLGYALRVMHERTGDAGALAEAVRFGREAAASAGTLPERHMLLGNLGFALYRQAQQEQPGTDVLTEAAAVMRKAIAATPDNDSVRAARLTALLGILGLLSERSGGAGEPGGDPGILADAADAGRAAVSATPADDPAYAARMHLLGFALHRLYERVRDPELLAETIAARQAAVDATPAGDPDYADRWNKLGVAQMDDAVLLDRSIESFRAAVNGSSADDPYRAGYLANLASALRQLYERAGSDDALTEAERFGREAVSAVPGDHPDRAAVLNALAGILGQLHERTGHAGVLTEAVQATRDAIAADSVRDPKRLNTLVFLLPRLAMRSGERSALTEAVAAGREAAAAIAANDPDRATVLNNLAAALITLSERPWDEAVSAESVDVARQTVAVTPEGHPERPKHLNTLGFALLTRHKHTGDPAVIAAAAAACREAVGACADSTRVTSPDRALYLNNLAFALTRLFQEGDDTVLEEAVTMARLAVAAVPEGHPTWPERMNTLVVALGTRFWRTGEASLLTEAVASARDAVAAMPADAPSRAVILGNLGEQLLLWSVYTDDTSVLPEAIQTCRDALATALPGHPQRGPALGILGRALGRLSWLTGDVGGLADAVEATREAVAATRYGDISRPLYLAILMETLFRLFRRMETKDDGLLAEAVQAGRDAIAAAPATYSYRSGTLTVLGVVLGRLAARSADRNLLAEAVQAERDAVAALPPGHPHHAATVGCLGSALYSLSAETRDASLRAEAAHCALEAATDENASPVIRIAAYRVAVAAGRTGTGGAEPLAAAEAAVALLPQVAHSPLSLADRGYQLSGAGSLASLAVAAATAAGRPGRALELAEQSRGVLVAENIAARSGDVARLQAAAPALAAEFDELQARRDLLDQADGAAVAGPLAAGLDGAPDQGHAAYMALSAARRDARAAWEDLISRIHAVDGLADFMVPPTAAALTVHAADGPIVLVSVGLTHGDALVLTGDPAEPVRAIPLSDLTPGETVRRIDQLMTAAQETSADPLTDPLARVAAQRDVSDVLAWLWDTVAEPVLAALGFTGTPEEGKWPRVWWCPVGVMAYLPLHAAGHHEDAGPENPDRRACPRTVPDRVVSSYTTTVRGLAYARTQAVSMTNSTASGSGVAARSLIVAVPDADGALPLEDAEEEAAALAELIPAANVLPYPTREAVLAALAGCPVAHFACHGTFRWADPARSGLVLHDHESAPLTVADISSLRLGGGLAYLSACDTAIAGPEYVDEAVHITGAFHLAGYSHVVGTLWPVADRMARQVAEDFYGQLTSDGATVPDISRSAVALHNAIRRLRARYPAVPTVWAAYTHTGC